MKTYIKYIILNFTQKIFIISFVFFLLVLLLNLFDLSTTGLRFFTVYGPWGRPDMALFKFTKAIMNNNEIDVYNYGNHERDFTHVDDITKFI